MKPIKKGDFVLCYPGEKVTTAEGTRREKTYASDLGSYLFFHGKHW